MAEVERLAGDARPVLGICNGFQMLCEAGLLPGAMVANRDLNFICRHVHLQVESTASVLTANASVGDVLRIPLNSYEGNYVAPPADLAMIEGEGRVVLRYSDGAGRVGAGTNPNGSMNSIAGITNAGGNVAGLMPHPERATEDLLGSTDGRVLLESFVAAVALVPA
jgi:phosphoribosylformylglycinamidine synthase